MTTWRNGEQCAPHKPLLLLYVLAGYRQGHGGDAANLLI
ncbi:hypothetical protein AC47_4452 [Escherichia coli 2-316-03_S3_C3]|nr:hypothetical protein AC19_4659 [Escherichia coli 2-316-03_S3_C2]KDY00378.1 hypothetical protein AC47_4452 [Escherichia coli 2-316-03_S3_C3]